MPEDIPPGSYSFRLDMVGVERHDEDYTRGQTVTFGVPEAEPELKPFPVWQARDAPTGSGFVTVAAGSFHNLALRQE